MSSKSRKKCARNIPNPMTSPMHLFNFDAGDFEKAFLKGSLTTEEGGEEDFNDDELEAELLALIGKEHEPRIRDKKKPAVDLSLLNLKLDDVLSTDVDNVSDDEVDEDELLAELYALESSKSEPDLEGNDQHEVENDIIKAIHERQSAYDAALRDSRLQNDSMRIKRLERQKKALADLENQAKLGKNVNIDDLPPIPSTKVQKRECNNAPDFERSGTSLPHIPEMSDTQVSEKPKESEPKTTKDEKPADDLYSKIDLISFDNYFPPKTTEPETQEVLPIPDDAERLKQEPKQSEDSSVTVLPSENSYVPVTSTVIEQKSEVKVRRNVEEPKTADEYKRKAIEARHCGDLAAAREYLSKARELTSEDNEKKVLSADANDLLQRLNLALNEFRKKRAEAEQAADHSRKRRMSRIITQYENAIAATLKGVNYDYSSLPEPYGFPPLSVPENKSCNNDTGKNLSSKIVVREQVPSKNWLDMSERELKLAAIAAKQAGDVEKAKKYLYRAKTLNAQSGRPAEKIPNKDMEWHKIENDLEKQIQLCSHNKQLEDYSRQVLSQLKLCRARGDPLPAYHYESRALPVTDVGENDIELTLLQCHDIQCSHAFVKVSLPYPSSEKPQSFRFSVNTGAIAGGVTTFHIDRSDVRFRRAVGRKEIRFDLIQRCGLLNLSERVLGSGSIKLEEMRQRSVLNTVVEITQGRRKIGRIEVKLRIKYPLGFESAPVQNWLVIDQFPFEGKRSNNHKVESIQLLNFECELLQKQIENSSLNNISTDELKSKLNALKKRRDDALLALKTNGREYIIRHIHGLKAMLEGLEQQKQLSDASKNERQSNLIKSKMELVTREINSLTKK